MSSEPSPHNIQRRFVDWNNPIAQLVAQELIPETSKQAIDLSSLLIVLPTAQAARRLRSALIQRAPVTGLRTVTPNQLLQVPAEMHNVANHTQCLASWLIALQEIDYSEYDQIFPHTSNQPDVNWRMQSAKTFHNLRKQLVDSGKRISYVLNGLEKDFHEYERWEQLAKLESVYIQHLKSKGLFDPYAQMIKQSDNPVIPEKCTKIIVAAVPDPNPVAIRALNSLSKEIPVEIMVHAPEALAQHFDEWGRPTSETWNNHAVLLHTMDESPAQNTYSGKLLHEDAITLVNGPEDQAKAVCDFIAEKAADFGPGDFAIGIPDTDVIPAIQMELGKYDLKVHDPAGFEVKHHRIARYLKLWLELAGKDTFAGFAALLRHPDMKTDRLLLHALDTLQQEHLPLNLQDVWSYGSAELKELVNGTQARIKKLQNNPVQNIRSLLKETYLGKELNPEVEEDMYFIQASRAIQEALTQVEQAEFKLKSDEQISLFNQLIDGSTYYSVSHGDEIDLEGWLELHWNDAPALIITGMNEGLVPDSQPADVFLPESMREKLALRTDLQRYLRDSYLLAAMMMSRAGGNSQFVCAKINSRRDALKPSRLLFHCREEELPGLAAKLFNDAEKNKLNPDPVPTLKFKIPKKAWCKERISVTAFKNYLTCPFRFYLDYVLGMKHEDDRTIEMDALAFGNFVHESVEHCFKDNPELIESTDLNVLQAPLAASADKWIRKRYGKVLPLHLEVQKEVGLQRLSAFARIHIEHIKEGWRLIDSELPIRSNMAGITISGRIDRVEQHEDGRIRLLDIKTTDSVNKPNDTHLKTFKEEDHAAYREVEIKGKSKAWIDLQLPLYELLYRAQHPDVQEIELGYIVLPKALNEAGGYMFEGYSLDSSKSAQACVKGILSDISGNQFWPPTEKIRYDNFEELVIERLDDPEFAAWCNGGKKT